MMREWTTKQQLISGRGGFPFGCKRLLFMGSWFLGKLAAVEVLFLGTIYMVLMHTCAEHSKKTPPLGVANKNDQADKGYRAPVGEISCIFPFFRHFRRPPIPADPTQPYLGSNF